MSSASALRHTVPVLKVTATPLTVDQTLTTLGELVAENRPHAVVGHNLHSVTLYHSDARFAELYNSASIVLLDGAPLAWIWGRLYPAGRPDGVRARNYRVGSTDWLTQIAKVEGLSRVAVLGTGVEANGAAVSRVKRMLPHAKVEGFAGAGWSARREVEALEWLQGFGPQLVLVGLGMPLQERVISRYLSEGPAAVYCAVGGAIDQLGGTQRLAPRWVGRIGLEWAWRLLFHPRRVGYRVFVEPFVLAGLLVRLQFRGAPASSKGAAQ